MVQYAHRQGLDAVLASVTPKHSRFYRRLFDFRVFGGERAYPTVRNTIGVALWAEFARLQRERHASYLSLISDPLDDEELQPQPMSRVERDYFRPMIDPTFQCTPLGDGEDEAEARSAELAACVA